ncbi:MAG: pyridoxal-dependent decarboxylase [Bacteroidota bacterium]
MTDLLCRVYNPREFRDQAHKLVDLIADHLESSLSRTEETVLPWMEPEERLSEWKKFLDPDFDFNEFWSATIAETIHIHHPRYMGHQVCAAFPVSGLGDMLNGALNNGSAIYEMGPVSNAMERVVTDWLAKAIGMGPKSAGILTSGGSLGNLTALLAARQHQSGYNHWLEGKHDHFHPAVMVSAEAHYSIARAVQIMGWGDQGIVRVPADYNHRIDITKLEESLFNAKNQGLTVLAVVGNACSTSTGIYDPLEPLADFCNKHKLWFHVDGCHGGPAAITPKYRYLTSGIEKADSVVIDFHKMMGISALTTAVLFKNGDLSYETFDQKATYILHDSEKELWFNSAIRTLECTKNMMGVKVYSVLKIYGPEVFVDYVTACYDLGRTFADMLKTNPDFELPYEPQSNIVCYRYLAPGSNPDQLDRINSFVRKEIIESGKFYIVQTQINGKVYLRSSLMNPFTSEQDMVELLDFIRETAKSAV